MSISTLETVITPDDLLLMENAVSFELVNGQVMERSMGMDSSGIAAQILGLIWLFLRDHPLGIVFGADASYKCFADSADKVRKPDVSFIRFGRLPGDRRPQGHCLIPPDLAVEVLSPGDLAYEIEEKVAEYLATGVRLVWVVHPPTRTVRVHRPRSSPAGKVSELTDHELLTGEDVMPGFSCDIDAIFEEPRPQA